MEEGRREEGEGEGEGEEGGELNLNASRLLSYSKHTYQHPLEHQQL